MYRLKLAIALAILFLWASVNSQTLIGSDSRVGLRMDCVKEGNIRFRLENHSKWVVAIPTTLLHFSFGADRNPNKPKTTKLENGGIVFYLAKR
jgi:hypothetical protein